MTAASHPVEVRPFDATSASRAEWSAFHAFRAAGFAPLWQYVLYESDVAALRERLLA